MTISVLLTALLVLFAFSPSRQAQPAQPAPPVSPTPSSTDPNTPGSRSETKGIPTRTIPGFLIIGTVFDENALSFPGVEIRVRQKDEKKYRWQTYTNSRGEFAVRVPEGKEYELQVRARKYKDQKQQINSVNGDTQQRLSIKLEPADGGKKGEKP